MRVRFTALATLITGALVACGTPSPTQLMVMTKSFPLSWQYPSTTHADYSLTFMPSRVSLPSECIPFIAITLVNAHTGAPLGGKSKHNPEVVGSRSSRNNFGWSHQGSRWVFRFPNQKTLRQDRVYIKLECNLDTFVHSQTFRVPSS